LHCWDVLPVELSSGSTWSPLWSFERPYNIIVVLVVVSYDQYFLLLLLFTLSHVLQRATNYSSSTSSLRNTEKNWS